MCLRVYRLDSAYFVPIPCLAWAVCLKKTNVKLELLTYVDMLLMYEAGKRGGISQAIHKYAAANDKYMKNYNKNISSSYLQHLDTNNLYGWEMCKKLPVGNFSSAKNLLLYTEDFIKNYKDNSDNGYLLEVDVHYAKTLQHLHKDLPFLCERRKLSKSTKLITSLEDKEKYVVHISALKQALNHELKLMKVHRVIKFRQEAWLRPHIDMNTKIRKDAKNEFEKDIFKLMKNSVFGKTIENVRNHRDIKLVVINARRNKLVPEPNYHTCKHFSEDLMVTEIKKTEVCMNKRIYLGQAILDISKTLMYELWYDYLEFWYDCLHFCMIISEKQRKSKAMLYGWR